MNILFFDTETTGIPADYNAPISDAANWPRLVLLSMILANEAGQIIERTSFVVKPEGFTIPADVSLIHGITHEAAIEAGYQLRDALLAFQQNVEGADLVVGHNISFDRKIIGAELLRCNMADVMHGKPRICTMYSSTKYCNIPKANGKAGAKFPKLGELYAVLFDGEGFEEHNGDADVEATYKCFYELVKRGVITREMIVKAFAHHA